MCLPIQIRATTAEQRAHFAGGKTTTATAKLTAQMPDNWLKCKRPSEYYNHSPRFHCKYTHFWCIIQEITSPQRILIRKCKPIFADRCWSKWWTKMSEMLARAQRMTPRIENAHYEVIFKIYLDRLSIMNQLDGTNNTHTHTPLFNIWFASKWSIQHNTQCNGLLFKQFQNVYAFILE